MKWFHATSLAAAILLFTCVADAIWLFGYALPKNPPPPALTVPAPTAGAAKWDRYDSELDRAQIETGLRRRVIGSAIAVPVVVGFCIAMAALFAATKPTE
jgi:hypothetical protein